MENTSSAAGEPGKDPWPVPPQDKPAAPLSSDLLATIETIHQNTERFCEAVRRGGFSADAADLSGRLHALLVSATSLDADEPEDLLPWHLVRSLALDVGLEQNHPDVGLQVVTGIIRLHPPASVNARLLADKLKFERLMALAELELRMTRFDYVGAITLADALVATADNPDDLEVLRAVKLEVESEQALQAKRRKLGLGLVGVLLLSTLGFSFFFNQAAPLPPQVSTPVETFTTANLIEAPPVGENNLLTRPQLMWCQQRFKQLEFISVSINAKDDFLAARYVDAVTDYGSRCTKYRFQDSDQAAVAAEMAAFDVRTSANRIISDWEAERSALTSQTGTTGSASSSSLQDADPGSQAQPAPQRASDIFKK